MNSAKYYRTHRERYKQYYEENRDKINEAARRYYMNNKEKILAKNRNWRKRHRERIMELSDEEFLIAAGLRKSME